MKTSTAFQFVFGIAAYLCAPQVAASDITYHVDVDTSGLLGNPNTYGLDFQLVDGDSLNNSSALISNFNFGGGNADGAAIASGGASGDLLTAVHLADSDFYNDLFQGFIPGSSLSFDLSLASTATGPTPDSFAFGIDGGPTGFFDVFVQIDLENGAQTLHTFSPSHGVSAAVSAPDSGSMALFPIAMASLGLFRFFCGKSRIAL